MSITEGIVSKPVSFPVGRGVYGEREPDPYETSQDMAQELSFADFLDIINPLQHIPILNTLYRKITGDAISPTARVIGGGIYGGPIGLMASAFSNAVESQTGNDMGEHLLAALTGEELVAPSATSRQLAAAAEMAPTQSGGIATAKAPTAEERTPAPLPLAGESLLQPAADSQAALQQALIAAQHTIHGAPKSPPILAAAVEKTDSVHRAANAVKPAMPAFMPVASPMPVSLTQAIPAGPPSQVSEAMMKALDKYDAMVKARKASGTIDTTS